MANSVSQLVHNPNLTKPSTISDIDKQAKHRYTANLAQRLGYLAIALLASMGAGPALALQLPTVFSAGRPVIASDPFSPRSVNERSAAFYTHYGNESARGTLANREARQWYLTKLA